jgi:hypothetical protein
MNRRLAALLICLPLLAAAPAGDSPLYSEDFAQAAPGKLPDDSSSCWPAASR